MKTIVLVLVPLVALILSISPPPLYALSAGQVTATLISPKQIVPVGGTTTITLRLSASEHIPLRGAQFSLLTPDHVTISNVQSHLNLGTNDAFAAIAAKEGVTNTIKPVQVWIYQQPESGTTITYNEVQITFLTVNPHTLPTASGAVHLVSFDVSPTREGAFQIWFRDNSFVEPFPHAVVDDTTNFLNTTALSSLTLRTSSSTTPGDADGDGDVDIFDYSIVITHFGQSVSGRDKGDMDSDGDVDIFDYNLVLTHFGT